MAKIIKLTESDLKRIITKVIKEQSQWKPDLGKPSQGIPGSCNIDKSCIEHYNYLNKNFGYTCLTRTQNGYQLRSNNPNYQHLYVILNPTPGGGCYIDYYCKGACQPFEGSIKYPEEILEVAKKCKPCKKPNPTPKPPNPTPKPPKPVYG